jgi:hypothetical protein
MNPHGECVRGAGHRLDSQAFGIATSLPCCSTRRLRADTTTTGRTETAGAGHANGSPALRAGQMPTPGSEFSGPASDQTWACWTIWAPFGDGRFRWDCSHSKNWAGDPVSARWFGSSVPHQQRPSPLVHHEPLMIGTMNPLSWHFLRGSVVLIDDGRGACGPAWSIINRIRADCPHRCRQSRDGRRPSEDIEAGPGAGVPATAGVEPYSGAALDGWRRRDTNRRPEPGSEGSCRTDSDHAERRTAAASSSITMST